MQIAWLSLEPGTLLGTLLGSVPCAHDSPWILSQIVDIVVLVCGCMITTGFDWILSEITDALN